MPSAIAANTAKKPNPMLAVLSVHGNELVENPGFSLFRGIMIAGPQSFEELLSRVRADSFVHRLPPDFGNNLMRQQPTLGNINDESMRPGNLMVADQVSIRMGFREGSPPATRQRLQTNGKTPDRLSLDRGFFFGELNPGGDLLSQAQRATYHRRRGA